MRDKKIELLPSTERLLREAEIILREVPSGAVTVGGAVAMAFRGFSRFTADLDLFAYESFRHQILEAFKVRGGYTIDNSWEPFLYSVLPPWSDDPSVKIDLLFPAEGDYDETAIALSSGVDIISLPVISGEGLALSRLYSDDPKHEIDLMVMVQRDMFSGQSLRGLIRGDKEALGKLRRIEKLAHKRTNPPWGKRGKWRSGGKSPRRGMGGRP